MVDVVSGTKITENQDIPCQVCDKSLEVPFNLKLHQESNCFTYPIQCRECSEKLETFMDHLTHQIKKHHFFNDDTCPGCQKKFINANSLNEHYRAFHIPAYMLTHTCYVCNRKFYTRQVLLRHMAGNHRIRADDARQAMPKSGRICSLCKRYFKGSIEYFAHKRACFNNHFRLRCAFCNEKFLNQGELKRHRSRCSPLKFFKEDSEGKYECLACHTAVSKKGLTPHYRICSLRSGRPAPLAKKKRNDGERKKISIVCPGCKIEYQDRKQFVEHLNPEVDNGCSAILFFEMIDEDLSRCTLCNNQVAIKTVNILNHVTRCILWPLCTLCNKATPFLSRHFEQHHPGLDSNSFVQKTGFVHGDSSVDIHVPSPSPMSVSRRLKILSSDSRVKCGICKYPLTKSELAEHRETCFPKFFLKTDAGHFQCNRCGSVIMYSRNLYGHVIVCKQSKAFLYEGHSDQMSESPSVESIEDSLPENETKNFFEEKKCGVCRKGFSNDEARSEHYIACLNKYFEDTGSESYKCLSCEQIVASAEIENHTSSCLVHREALKRDGIFEAPQSTPRLNLRRPPPRKFNKSFGKTKRTICGVCRKFFPDKTAVQIHRKICFAARFEIVDSDSCRCKICGMICITKTVAKHTLKCSSRSSSFCSVSVNESPIKSEPIDNGALNFEDSFGLLESTEMTSLTLDDVDTPATDDNDMVVPSEEEPIEEEANQLPSRDEPVFVKPEPLSDTEVVLDDHEQL